MAAGHAGQPGPASDPSVFPTAQWTHVGVTYDWVTRKYTLYKNGAYVSSGIAGTSPNTFTGTTLGRYGGVNDWLGYMDDMQQWGNVVLSSGQMQAVYEGNL